MISHPASNNHRDREDEHMQIQRSLFAWVFPAVLLVAHPGFSQNTVSDKGEIHSSSRVALGATLSTAGPGLNLSLEASRSLVLRLGFEQLAFSIPFSFEENEIDYNADLDYKAGSLSLMADWHYYRSLFVTLGAGYNLFHPVVDGIAGSDWVEVLTGLAAGETIIVGPPEGLEEGDKVRQ